MRAEVCDLWRIMTITYHPFSPEQIRQSQTQLVAIYAEAFQQPPYSKSAEEVTEFAHYLAPATQRTAFCAVVAQHAKIGQPVGFCYGYACDEGSGFYQAVAPMLTTELRAMWLTDAFQLAEMAVLPTYQGRGIGRKLHDHLLANQPYRKAILATMQAATNASKLYDKCGWQPLIDSLNVPNIPRLYRVLVRRW